jgi:hypothetical protein
MVKINPQASGILWEYAEDFSSLSGAPSGDTKTPLPFLPESRVKRSWAEPPVYFCSSGRIFSK